MGEYIQLEISDGIGRLTLNRPEKRNALRRESIEEMRDGLAQIRAQAGLRLVILAAQGPVFCAGMDLGEMQERASSPDGQAEWLRDSEIYCELLIDLISLPLPVVAAVSGPALAGGMGLVLACDITVASDNVFFMLPEPMRGITAAMVTPLLVHRIGPGPATCLLLSGEKVSAQKALGMNLCYDVVAPANLESRLDKLTTAILTGSPDALAITKQHLQQTLPVDLATQLRKSVEISATARQTADAREGLAAFLEKRKPAWCAAE